jgi:YesN/AraC family two-component response regulator
LLADKFLENNYKYLSNRIHKEYDTKKLLASKNEIEKSLTFRKQLDIAFGVIIVLLIGLIGYLVQRSIENRRKFRKLMARKEKTVKPVVEKKPIGELDINPEVVASVLKGLDKFERTEKYREKDITLPKLASMFDSNIVYVSKIISHHKHKKSIDYINDLKIDYIINQLQSNSRVRNYTNKALGEEAGFSTTQHFTRAFSKNTGISPTYFIQKLKKTIASGKSQ